MKKLLALAIGISVWGIGSTQAADIQNLKVTVNGEFLYIQWDPLSSSDLENTDGYAVQWADSLSKVRNVEPAKQFLSDSRNSISLRLGGFEKNMDHYFRVHTYEKEGRRRYLENGSKVIKIQINNSKKISTTETLTASDAVISRSTENTNSSSSSTSGDYEFSKIHTKIFDNFTIINWSHPRMAASEYSHYGIEISEKSSFTEILKKAVLDADQKSLKIEGMKPDTVYYVRGFFIKSGNDIGKKKVEIVRTKATFTAAQQSRLDRIIKRGLLKINADETINLGETTTTTTSSANNSSSTNTTSRSTSTSNKATTRTTTRTSTNTTKTEITSKSSKAEINAEIKRILKEMSTLRAEYLRLKRLLR